MAPMRVCVLALAAVLLLGISTMSRSKGLGGQKHQRASQIPSQFSQGERVAMKEALKGEPGPLRPPMLRYRSLSPWAKEKKWAHSPLLRHWVRHWNWSSATRPKPTLARVPAPRPQTCR